jgi:hypothetical protein
MAPRLINSTTIGSSMGVSIAYFYLWSLLLASAHSVEACTRPPLRSASLFATAHKDEHRTRFLSFAIACKGEDQATPETTICLHSHLGNLGSQA